MAELERTTMTDIQLREHDAMKAELASLRAQLENGAREISYLKTIIDDWDEQLADAQAGERERAAKVADKVAEAHASLAFAHGAAKSIAERIRALSPNPNQEKPE